MKTKYTAVIALIAVLALSACATNRTDELLDTLHQHGCAVSKYSESTKSGSRSVECK